MKKIGFFAILLAVCWTSTMPASADQLYVRNKIYKGTTEGSGMEMQADLQGLVGALGLKLTAVDSNWVITSGSEAPAVPAGASGSGHVYFHGKVIAEATSATALVSVKDLAQAAGAAIMPNKALGTVDVTKAVAKMDSGAPVWKAHNNIEAYAPTPKFRVVSFDATW